MFFLCIDNLHGWCAAVLGDKQFLQIDFIHEVKITKLLVQGLIMHVGVELFFLEHSLDDKNWRNYTEYGTTRVGGYLKRINFCMLLSFIHFYLKQVKKV